MALRRTPTAAPPERSIPVKLSVREPAATDTESLCGRRHPPAAPGRSGPLRVVGNILWLLLAGIWMSVGYLVAGLIQCITIIGNPFRLASFKLAGLALVPFGKMVVKAGAPMPPNASVYLSV